MGINVKKQLKKNKLILYSWKKVYNAKNYIMNIYLKHKIINYYKKTEDPEVIEILSFLKKKPFISL